MFGRLMVRSGVLFFAVVILFFALVIQLFRWQRAVETERDLAEVETAHIKTAYEEKLGQVSDAEAKLRALETELIWKNPDPLLPAIGTVSDKLSLAENSEPSASLVGVEELREWRRGDYGALPRQLTVSGNYTGILALLSVVERINPKVRIEEVRLYQRKRQLTPLWMSLTLAPMHKRDSGEWRVMSGEQFLNSPRSTSHSPLIEMPAIERYSVKRNPFAFDATAPQSSTAEIPVTETPLPTLTGILWNNVNPIAILNHGGRRLSASVGEQFAGAAILSIHPQHVLVKRGRQRHELRLWSPDNGTTLK